MSNIIKQAIASLVKLGIKAAGRLIYALKMLF